MKASFPQVRFMPFGGVNASNVAEYIKAGAWALGGTWMCKRELIEADDFPKISELVKEAVGILAAARK
jgi:2-dehydro-3-deoxyphosphogluconate aldolase/(4S)-4-hydroxy-2-oxoglutarate aldolase